MWILCVWLRDPSILVAIERTECPPNMKIWSPISSQFKFQHLTPSSRGERSIWSCIVKSCIYVVCVMVSDRKSRNMVYNFYKEIWLHLPNFKIHFSPRVLNIFYSGFFCSKSMTLLLDFRTFPAPSVEFWKSRHYTYWTSPSLDAHGYLERWN